jgi:hypothetical protein
MGNGAHGLNFAADAILERRFSGRLPGTMGGFFKGWRRKVGCVALVMACALLGLSIRAQFVLDSFYFQFTESPPSYWLVTTGSGVYWDGSSEVDMTTRSLSRWDTIPYTPKQPRDFTAWTPSDSVIWQRQWCGFYIGEIEASFGASSYWVVPYWAMILPLTLLSAFLILWPQRRAPRQTAIESDQSA